VYYAHQVSLTLGRRVYYAQQVSLTLGRTGYTMRNRGPSPYSIP